MNFRQLINESIIKNKERFGIQNQRKQFLCHDNNGHSLLHIAATLPNQEILPLLLNHFNFDVNERTTDEFRNTPLHLAIMNGREQSTAILLAKGAKTNILNAQKKTAYDLGKDDLDLMVKLKQEDTFSNDFTYFDSELIRSHAKWSKDKCFLFIRNKALPHQPRSCSEKFHWNIRPDHVRKAVNLIATSLYGHFYLWKVYIPNDNHRCGVHAQITIYIFEEQHLSTSIISDLKQIFFNLSLHLSNHQIAFVEAPLSDIQTIYPGLSMRAQRNTVGSYLSAVDNTVGSNYNPVNIRWQFSAITGPQPPFEMSHHFYRFPVKNHLDAFFSSIQLCIEAIINQFSPIAFQNSAHIRKSFTLWIVEKNIADVDLYAEYQQKIIVKTMIAKSLRLWHYMQQDEFTTNVATFFSLNDFSNYHIESDLLGDLLKLIEHEKKYYAFPNVTATILTLNEFLYEIFNKNAVVSASKHGFFKISPRKISSIKQPSLPAGDATNHDSNLRFDQK